MNKELKKSRNEFTLKFCVHASAMLEEMDNAKVNSEEAKVLTELFERILDNAYQSELLRSKPFLQTLENKIDTAIRKTCQEYNIKLV